MAIAHVSTGTVPNSGTTSVTVPYPGSLARENIVLVGRTTKPQTALADTAVGWTTSNSLLPNGSTGGTGTQAAGTGATRGKIDYRFVDGTEGSNFIFSQSNSPNSVAGVMVQYSKSSSTSWDVVYIGADDNTHGTSRSATAGSGISLQAGDLLIAFIHCDTNTATAWTTPSFTATGMTFGTYTFRLQQTGSAQGNDTGIAILDSPITAGAVASVAPGITLSAGPSSCGSTSFIRLREVPIQFPVVPITAPRVFA